MAYDHGIVERLRDIVPRLQGGAHGIREKNVFSGWGFLLGRNAFVIVWGQGIIVKTAPDFYATALAMRGVSPFTPGGERPMGTWVVVAADEVADDPELLEWAERGIAGVRAVPAPKPAKPRKAPTPRGKRR